jgi:hypothetical protein
MDARSRIEAVLHRQRVDRVPFVVYDNLFPRGQFERELRNRGMGLCARCSTVYARMPNVSVETRHEGETTLTIYHTPVGDVSTRSRTHTGRVSDNMAIEVEGMIKSERDYEPVIFMLEDTVFEADWSLYTDLARDLGGDGIVRDAAIDPFFESPPYGATRRFFGDLYGLDRWAYAQRDHPDHFARLLEAVERREERRLKLVAQSPAEFVAFGWLGGLWSASAFEQYELPFYQKWVPYLQAHGKVCALHADATNLKAYASLIARTGVDVVEAFTPPPVGDLSLKEARRAWGERVIIWVNIPETVFYFGPEATRDYARQLLEEAATKEGLVIGFTEMGIWGATDESTYAAFRAGILALAEALEDYGHCP